MDHPTPGGEDNLLLGCACLAEFIIPLPNPKPLRPLGLLHSTPDCLRDSPFRGTSSGKTTIHFCLNPRHQANAKGRKPRARHRRRIWYWIVLRILKDFIAHSSQYELVFKCTSGSEYTDAFILLRDWYRDRPTCFQNCLGDPSGPDGLTRVVGQRDLDSPCLTVPQQALLSCLSTDLRPMSFPFGEAWF